MNFRALFLSIQRVLGIFSSRENDVAELMMKDVSSLSPFAQIIGDQKYTVPDHPNLEVLKLTHPQLGRLGYKRLMSSLFFLFTEINCTQSL